MILTARWLAPLDRPLIEDGGICVEQGRIVQIGARRDLPAGPTEDLGDVVLLPGLINAHAHLELTGYAGQLEPASLWMWLRRLVKLRRAADPRDERAAAARGAAESLRAGVTCVVDISRRGDTWPALADVPIRKICCAELISVANEPPRTPTELENAVADVACDDLLAAGVSPHAPYTVAAEDFEGTVALARRRGLPITTHWAETREERRWLSRGGGVLGAMIWAFGGSEVIRSPKCAPIEYAERLGLLSAGAVLAHVNYIDDEELGRLARSAASVVYCPRSHRFFGHRDHRWADMLAAGVNVCIGTDSAASLPAGATLSVLDELRVLRQDRPDVPAETLTGMATTRAARALGLDGQLGTLTPGKRADIVAVPLTGQGIEDPLEDVLTGQAVPAGVWIDGLRRVPLSDGVGG